jgi:hypothetical protein
MEGNQARHPPEFVPVGFEFFTFGISVPVTGRINVAISASLAVLLSIGRAISPTSSQRKPISPVRQNGRAFGDLKRQVH